MKYELKAMGVGGILDQSIRLFKENFGLFMLIMVCMQIPVSMVSQFAAVVTTPELPPHATPEETMALMRHSMNSAFLIHLPLALLIGLTVVPITNAAIMHATANIYLGRPTNIKDAFHVGFRRFLPLAWTWFLVYVLFLGGLVLCILPGILLLFRYALATNVAVLEGISGVPALNRSRDLMISDRTKHYNTLFLLGLVLVIISFGIGIGSQYIPNKYVAAFVAVLLSSINGAFWLVAMVVFYFSCRCRAENFDLMQLAQAVGETEPTSGMPTGGVMGQTTFGDGA